MQQPVVIGIKCTGCGSLFNEMNTTPTANSYAPLPHAVSTGKRRRACVWWQVTRLKGKYWGSYSSVRWRCHASSGMLLCPCVNSHRLFPRVERSHWRKFPEHHHLAKVFSDYFINVTNTHQTNDINTNLQALSNLYLVFNKPYPQLNLTPVNAKEIKDIIRTLKWKSSCGYDEVPLKILKN